MKIYFISNYFYPEIGAAPKRISEMALGLKDAGNHVEVACPLPNYPFGKIFEEYRGRYYRKEEYKGITIRRYWVSPSISKNPIVRIWSMFSFAFNLLFEIRHLRKYKPDCIIIQNSPLFVSFMGIIVSKVISRSKVVLNISDLWPLSALELGAIKSGALYRILKWIERFNYQHSNLIVGQSDEIIEHVTNIALKASFLYRNLSASKVEEREYTENPANMAIIYAGLLGVAQGVYELVKNINFKSYGIELHIYGNGNETKQITDYISVHPDHGIYYKGALSHKKIIEILPHYKAALVPLRIRIKGAVPSKIFEMATAGVPVLFCGGGEGENIVNRYKLGFTSPPNDFEALSYNIYRMAQMSLKEYLLLKQSCLEASHSYFSFDKQMKSFNKRLNEIIT